MKVLNYSDFRSRLSESLNSVNEDQEIVVVSRPKGKNVVIMDLDEYNSIQETLHLLSNQTNRTRLHSAIEEMQNGNYSNHKLIEE